MAVIRCRGGFPPLRNAARFCIALPDLPAEGESFPVLWLLGEEGRSADALLRDCAVEALAVRYGIAVVMPEGLHSDYEDMQRGLDWYTYLYVGLPRYLKERLCLETDGASNAVFGFGMGGLGALRLTLRRPDFARVFGGAEFDADPFARDGAHDTPAYRHKMETIYGDDFRREEVLQKSDLFRLAQAREALPPIALYAREGSDRLPALRRLEEALRGKSRDLSLTTFESTRFQDAVLESFVRDRMKAASLLQNGTERKA